MADRQREREAHWRSGPRSSRSSLAARRRAGGTRLRPRGLTLLEVLLTLSLMVVMAGLLLPVLGRSFASQRLRTAGDQIRSEWGRARVAAMTTGQTMAFRFAVEGNRYCVSPLDMGAELEAAAIGGAIVSPAAGGNAAWTAPREGTLPEDVVFHLDVAAMASEVAYDPLGTIHPAGGDSPEFGWSMPILFHPDGTASTAEVILRNQRDQIVPVRLRGLTGVVTVGELIPLEEWYP